MKLFKYSISDLKLNLLQFTATTKDEKLKNKQIKEINQQAVDILEELSAETRDQVNILYY
jgi:hypothetical protein